MRHTRFFEEDRDASNFWMYCQDDGQFAFINEPRNWPKCLEGCI